MSNDYFSSATFHAPLARCRRMADILLKHLNPQRPLNIADIGCGTGNQIFELHRLMPHACFTGIDISQDNIRIAKQRQRLLRLGGNIRFDVADYLAYRRNSQFDAILSDSTLHNIQAPTDQLFDKISNDLTQGGYLMATLPYNCLYNHLLWFVRRELRRFRTDATDKLLLLLGAMIYRGEYETVLLEERIGYMYLTPKFYSHSSLRKRLERDFGLVKIDEQPVAHEGLGQPKHVLLIFQKHNCL